MRNNEGFMLELLKHEGTQQHAVMHEQAQEYLHVGELINKWIIFILPHIPDSFKNLKNAGKILF